jgi:hypothetical protein
MSSSRSIAAARNRRAGGSEQPPAPRPRPNTSIASQAAFSQQQPQQQQQIRRPGQNNFPTKQPQPVPHSNKISISDAIGLITIRLGRVEQYMQGLQEQDGTIPSFQGSENLQLIDKDVIRNLTDRIYTLENKPQQQQQNNALMNQISVLEKEIKEIKELKALLEIQTNKFDHFVTETEQKFTDVDIAFADLEQQIQPSSHVEIENIQLDVEEKEEKEEKGEKGEKEKEESNGPTFSSIDLKNAIQQELANTEI